MILYRLSDIFTLFPVRLKRLFQHFSQVATFRLSDWLIELHFLIFELIGIFDLYDAFASLIKRASPLSAREMGIATSIFGNSLHYNRIRIDNRAYIGARKGNFCYVSCNTINSWGAMSDAILIHELMHVWQYQHLGIVYIPRALAAQFTTEGYNYGGVSALYEAIKNNKKLLDFNYEQQADMIEDYYRILMGYQPSWGNGDSNDLEVYAHFAKQLLIKNGTNPNE